MSSTDPITPKHQDLIERVIALSTEVSNLRLDTPVRRRNLLLAYNHLEDAAFRLGLALTEPEHGPGT